MAEKEYIERNELIRYAEDELRMQGNLFRRAVESCPTADVVEVKHATWVSVDADVIFRCSYCDAEVSTSWDYENDDMFHYCPCCGAKMDGGGV